MRVLRVFHSAVVTPWRERERALIRRGHSVTLVSAQVWNEFGRQVPLEPGDDGFVVGARTFGTHPSMFVMDPRVLWRALGEQQWDVIDIHEEPNSLIVLQVRLLRALRSRTRRVPYLMYSAQNIEKRYPLPFRLIERAALRRSAGMYVCNAEAGRIMHRKGLRGPAPVIPLGVDVAAFEPANRSRPASALQVGYVGRLEPHKGVDVLIEAIGQLPEARLTVVGAGPDEEKLRAQAKRQAPGRVEFVGSCSGPALVARYQSFDVLAVPSLVTSYWLEQFGRVVIEAMACGVPVVASDSGALPEVVGTAGVLVAPGEAAALAQQLRALANDVERWERLREAGLARAATYTWDRVAGDFEDLYRAATTKGPAAVAPTRRPPLEIAVVAYGTPELLRDCLTPLAGQFPVVIVDNSSRDDTRLLAQELGARYVDAGRNRGFAGGVNLALANRAHPDGDVLLLNPDAGISADGVAHLQEQLHSAPRIAAVAPAQLEPGSGAPVQVTWPFPTPAGAWLESIGLGRLNDRKSGFLIGSILLLNGAALDELGGLDERYFLYAEETDWQYGAVQAGWTLRLVKDVSGTHVGSGTGGDPTFRETNFHASHELYMRKHYGGTGWLAYRGAVLAGAGVRALVLPKGRREPHRFRAGLAWNGPVRRLRELQR